MHPKEIQAIYAELRSLLDAATPGEIDAGIAPRLADGFERLATQWDFNAIAHIGDRLQLTDAVSRTAPQPLRRAHTLYVDAQLRLRPFEDGWPLLRAALDRLPEDPGLLNLQIRYLWHHAPEQLVLMHREGQAHLRPQIGAIWGEIMLREGMPDRALQTAMLAEVGPRKRLDLLCLGVNAAETPARKLAWFNTRLEADGLSPLQLKDPDRFDIDSVIGTKLEPIREGPLVTVVMTAFNAAAWIERAAHSVLNQTWRRLELVILDDGSSDETVATAKTVARRDKRVTIVERKGNAGTYVARNEALTKAQGTFVTFVDSDDWCHPQRIARAMAVLTAEPDLMAHQSAWVRIDAEGRIVLREDGGYSELNPAGLTIRREPVLKKAGYFAPQRTGADSEYRFRIRAQMGPNRFRYDPAIVTLGRRHATSLTTSGPGKLDCFGWSVPRALYRGAWLDLAVAGKRTGAAWAPLSIRRHAVPAPYGTAQLATHDALHRLGGTGRPEDVLILLRGKLPETVLSQIRRLALGGWKAGYRIAMGVEETPALALTRPIAALAAEAKIPIHDRIDRIDAGLVMVARAEGSVLNLRLLTPDLMTLEPAPALARTPPPAQADTIAAYLPDPGLETFTAQLAQVPPAEMLVAAHGPLRRFWRLGESNIALARMAAPDAAAHGLLVVTGGQWTEGERADLAHMAKALGRRAVQITPDVQRLAEEHGLPALGRQPAPLPLLPESNFTLVAPGAAKVIANLADRSGQPLPEPAEARPGVAQLRGLLDRVSRSKVAYEALDLRVKLQSLRHRATAEGDPLSAKPKGQKEPIT